MKHIKQDFSLKAWVLSSGVNRGWDKGNIIFSWNMVMLHIKLKPTTQSATW